MVIDAAIQAIADELLVGRIALGLGVGTAPVEVPGTEFMLAGQLSVHQRTLEPLGIGIQHLTPGQFVIALALTGRLRCAVNIEVGPLDLIVTPFQTHAKQAVQHDVVAGGHEVIVGAGFDLAVLDETFLLLTLAGAPAVLEAADGDHAQIAPAQIEGLASADVGLEVERDLVLLLNQVQRGIDQALANTGQLGVGEIARADALAARQGLAQFGRLVAGAVIIAQHVGVRAVIGQALVEGGLGVAASPNAKREEGFVGNRDRLQIDQAAAELAGIVGRIALLDAGAGQDAGGKQVQRHDALQGLGAGQG